MATTAVVSPPGSPRQGFAQSRQQSVHNPKRGRKNFRKTAFCWLSKILMGSSPDMAGFEGK
jgi:hypothetical protein